MTEISNIEITLETGPNGECPFCNGKGYVRFMQKAATVNGPSLRMDDILVGCTFCHGTGKIEEHFQKELYPGAKDNWKYHNKRWKEAE